MIGWTGVCAQERGSTNSVRRGWYFVAGQLAPAPQLARLIGRAALTHLCQLLCSVSAALASFSRMDFTSNSYTFFDLRSHAHFLPFRPVDSTAYHTPPFWVLIARANPVHRSLHRPPRTSRTPRGPSLQTEHSALSACDTVSPQAKPHSPCSSRAASHEQGNPRDPTLMTNDPAASLHPPRRAAPRSTRTLPASDLHYLTPGPPARRRKRFPNAPDSTRRPIPTPPSLLHPPWPHTGLHTARRASRHRTRTNHQNSSPYCSSNPPRLFTHSCGALSLQRCS